MGFQVKRGTMNKTLIKRTPPTRKFAIEFRDDKIRRCPFHVVLLERKGDGPWKEVLRGAKRRFYKWVLFDEVSINLKAF